MDLIPPQMKRQMVKRDSLRQAQQMAAAKKAARDTSGVQEAPEEIETESTPIKPNPAKTPKKDSWRTAAVLPEELRKSTTVKRKTAA